MASLEFSEKQRKLSAEELFNQALDSLHNEEKAVLNDLKGFHGDQSITWKNGLIKFLTKEIRVESENYEHRILELFVRELEEEKDALISKKHSKKTSDVHEYRIAEAKWKMVAKIFAVVSEKGDHKATKEAKNKTKNATDKNELAKEKIGSTIGNIINQVKWAAGKILGIKSWMEPWETYRANEARLKAELQRKQQPTLNQGGTPPTAQAPPATNASIDGKEKMMQKNSQMLDKSFTTRPANDTIPSEVASQIGANDTLPSDILSQKASNDTLPVISDIKNTQKPENDTLPESISNQTSVNDNAAVTHQQITDALASVEAGNSNASESTTSAPSSQVSNIADAKVKKVA